MTFYVTNTTAVKLLGLGRSGTADYPAFLNVFECTVNADGSLSISPTAVKSVKSTSTSTTTPFNIVADDLDASKIYKVEVGQYRGYLYEIGFQTPIVVEKIPTITAEPTELTFETIYATTEATQTFTFRGKYLEDVVAVTINDDNNAFRVDRIEIILEEAIDGAAINVTFHPAEAGSYNATITLSSEGAEPVDITINGTAEAATPTILPSEKELTFIAAIDSDQSQTLTVTGRFINNTVTLTLSDPNHVFSVSPTTLPAEALAEGSEVTVTFNSPVEGTFAGTLTLTSEGADPVNISLVATANDGGTASDLYLNIAKYATINEAGWNTTYVNTLYNYSEYEEDEVAWLTIPVYGAWSSVYYSPKAQKWISTNVSDLSSTRYAGTSWSGSAELLGSSIYFTGSSGNGAARAMGYNSRRNTTLETVTFFVTNTTAVKLLGLGQNRVESSYPASLRIYECTANDDGSLTAAATAIRSESNASTSGSFVLAANDLDASKIYKVEASTYRSYICEIGFQTPLPKHVLIGDVNRDGAVTIADVTALVNIILGKSNDEYDLDAADVNRDGAMTIADVTALVNIILNKQG